MTDRHPPTTSPFLKRWLEERGQRADMLARAIDIDKVAFYRMLRGEKPIPLPIAHAVCQFLKEDYATLFPDHSGIDPRDLDAIKHADLIKPDLVGAA